MNDLPENGEIREKIGRILGTVESLQSVQAERRNEAKAAEERLWSEVRNIKHEFRQNDHTAALAVDAATRRLDNVDRELRGIVDTLGDLKLHDTAAVLAVDDAKDRLDTVDHELREIMKVLHEVRETVQTFSDLKTRLMGMSLVLSAIFGAFLWLMEHFWSPIWNWVRGHFG